VFLLSLPLTIQSPSLGISLARHLQSLVEKSFHSLKRNVEQTSNSALFEFVVNFYKTVTGGRLESGVRAECIRRYPAFMYHRCVIALIRILTVDINYVDDLNSEDRQSC
jgi:hypothetical protein